MLGNCAVCIRSSRVFQIVTTLDGLVKAFSIRAIVFIEEQQCTYQDELDGLDYAAVHILGEHDSEPFGVGRIRFLGDYAKLERIALRKTYRGQGYGNQLIEFMIAVARERGYHKYKLHAQVQAIGFYEKHSFVADGEVFEEAGIPHRLMLRDG